MKVYVVERCATPGDRNISESCWLVGVFSTLELAEEHASKRRRDDVVLGYEWDVTEMTVDEFVEWRA
jgi:hypothetical protein